MRCLSLLLIISLFAVCAIPASAASVPGQYDVVDLLASGFFPDGDLVDTRAATSYTFNWDVTSSSSIAYVYLNVYAPTAPSSVSLNGVSGTRVYSGAFYQYKFSMSRVLSSCSVVVRFSSSASRTVSIGYCVGSISGQDVFTKFNMRSRGYNSSSFGSTTSNIAIPYTGNFVSTITESLPTSQIVNDFELQFDPALSSADYATIHLLVPGGQAPSADGFRTPWAIDPAFFLGPGWTHTYPLSVISTDSFYDATTTVGIGRGCWHYVYTVDVSGYDLSSYNIMCALSVIGDPNPSIPTQYRFKFTVLSSCVGLNPDSGSPFRAFTAWLNTQFSNIRTSISTLGTTIVSQFSGLKTSLSVWFSSLEQKIQSAVNPTVPDAVSDSQNSVDSDIGAMEEFEKSQYDKINNGVSSVQTGVSSGIGNFHSALAFVQTYTTGIAAGIKDYLIVFTLPIFVGIFLYICSRAPGVTNSFRARRPKK